MKVVLFSKKTELERHIEETAADRLELLRQIDSCSQRRDVEDIVKQLGIRGEDSQQFFATAHIVHYRALQTAQEVLEREHIPYERVLRQGELEAIAEDTLLVALGGDGTFLDICYRVNEVPILVVKSSEGSIGHYCACDISEFEEAVRKIKSGDYRIVEQRKVSCRVGGRTLHAMNDFTVAQLPGTRVLISDSMGRDYFNCANVIVTSPQGQTGYYRDAGGREFSDESSIGYVITAPLSREYAVPLNDVGERVVITSKSYSTIIIPDAFMERSVPLEYDQEATFFLGPHVGRVIKFDNQNAP